MATERVTITLPAEVVRDIDRRERNRSRFVLLAVKRELERRRREELRRSLANPHPETEVLAELGVASWTGEHDEADELLLDESAGTDVRWIPGQGWVEVSE